MSAAFVCCGVLPFKVRTPSTSIPNRTRSCLDPFLLPFRRSNASRTQRAAGAVALCAPPLQRINLCNSIVSARIVWIITLDRTLLSLSSRHKVFILFKVHVLRLYNNNSIVCICIGSFITARARLLIIQSHVLITKIYT